MIQYNTLFFDIPKRLKESGGQSTQLQIIYILHFEWLKDFFVKNSSEMDKT